MSGRQRIQDKRKKFMTGASWEIQSTSLCGFREMAGLLLGLSKDEKKRICGRVLDELVAEGKADLDSKGRYSKVTGSKRGEREAAWKEKTCRQVIG